LNHNRGVVAPSAIVKERSQKPSPQDQRKKRKKKTNQPGGGKVETGTMLTLANSWGRGQPEENVSLQGKKKNQKEKKLNNQN